MGKPTFEQTEEFYRLVDSGRVNRQNFTAYLRDPDAYLASKIEIVSPMFRILTVTIDRARGYEKARDAGEYDFVNPYINPKDYPMKKGEGVVAVKVGVFTLGRIASDGEVAAHREKLGLLPIGMEHEFAVGEQFRELQRELVWIVNRDMIRTGENGSKFSCLSGNNGKRNLTEITFLDYWHNGWWFLGLCK